jgi:signal transduction histidine kinase
MITMLINASKQRKALEKERVIRQQEEEKNRAIAVRKVELEALVAERTTEITRQKEELELALIELKATQNQLIQKEKMASLGELTAGIAHEIQNPLNFVNNFSEVSAELVSEIKEKLERIKFNTADQEDINNLLNDLITNQHKISQHGKRADIIIKSMLQHSRTSTGQKEPTDMNLLADEYLRLSYHGMKARDKSFSANLQTEFTPGIGKINVIPQDIGRVLLNLFNNAFYSVNEKKKLINGTYLPTVSIQTKMVLDKLEICIRDNGNGIPKKVLNKIFQPFFTTKPTGEGTGLGLSLSYEIITKEHGGEMKVSTHENEFAEFIIQLPAK